MIYKNKEFNKIVRQTKEIAQMIEDDMPRDDDGLYLHYTPAGVHNLMGLILKYGYEEVETSARISISKYEGEQVYEKLGGILYNRHNAR